MKCCRNWGVPATGRFKRLADQLSYVSKMLGSLMVGRFRNLTWQIRRVFMSKL